MVDVWCAVRVLGARRKKNRFEIGIGIGKKTNENQTPKSVARRRLALSTAWSGRRRRVVIIGRRRDVGDGRFRRDDDTLTR